MALLTDCWQAKRKMLSVYKCYKALLQCGDLLRNALFKCPKNMAVYVTIIKCIDRKNLLLEKRKDHLSFYEILATCVEKNKNRIIFEEETALKKISRATPKKINARLSKNQHKYE